MIKVGENIDSLTASNITVSQKLNRSASTTTRQVYFAMVD
ncbi:hypothetical protein PCIT_a1290 [Pseudoalteromonas citrea]|uniref:Uncharacterized protein n=1 Tax=Pseudoalteromonas citrea TaxID=43655 RepID=A0AAD4FTS8_9GAMM|nr:hypothetical protein PCIT_a1290 [Pseudoalteromonas citrea]